MSMETSGGETSVGTSTTGNITEGPRLDVPMPLDLGVGELDCEAVDFLFVIDNSSSMEREQGELIAAVPGFTASILDALPSVSDIRVGVVDTDSYPALGTVDPLDGCPGGSVDCTSCDYTLGALLTKPASAIDPAMDCGFSSGQPWMEARSEGFDREFACVADVGIEGNQVEQQAGALVSAVSPELQGGCNAGFLREEALLIFLVVTDEEDDREDPPPPRGGSVGDPGDWYDALVAAKGGQATNVVALGLTGGAPAFGNCEALEGGQGAEPAPRLTTFLESFETSYTGSVCASNYEAFFDDALMSVARGCAQFVPG